jgi:glycosyltransferase involved in cell wall biosynthesis
MYRTCEAGLFQTRMLTGIVDYCLADSEFNRQELLKMGYTCPIDVQPILIPFSEYDREPDDEFMKRFSDGKVNILFTGRLAPNKKQDDLIQAFRVFHQLVPESRLIIAGAYDRSERYVDDLIEYVGDIGLSDDILFTGHIPFEKIIALYRTASFFWCLSEHEGFCVPLVEAMYFGIPIIAYNSSAVPETLGGSGVLLDDKQPELVARVTKALMDDFGMRTGIIERQWMQLGRFSYENVAARFRRNLARIIASFQEDFR